MNLNFQTPISENPHAPLLPAGAYASDGMREATLHRPYPSSHSQYASPAAYASPPVRYASPAPYSTSPQPYTPTQQYPSHSPAQQQQAYYERTMSPAPMGAHRQQQSQDYFGHAGSARTSPDSSSFGGHVPVPPPGLDDGSTNMAGRGAHRAM